MEYIRSTISTLLTLSLILFVGLGTAAHALSDASVGGHCLDHIGMDGGMYHNDHVLTDPNGEVRHTPDSPQQEECNPFLCSVLALTTQISETKLDRSAVALTPEFAGLATLDVPDHPDRPPNT